MYEDTVYKVLLLGDSSVGKTCFLLRYCDRTFQEAHLSTIGLDYRLKTMTLENNKIIFNQMNMINITCMNFIYKIIYFNNNFFSYLWLDITDSFFLY